MNAQTQDEHGRSQAESWAAHIRELVAALEADYDRREELRDQEERDDETTELAELEAATTIDGDRMANADEARERIQESVLEIQVRSDWHAPGAEPEAPSEFTILLCTGGPAVRIMGELDEHGTPDRAWLEFQDWGTPWTHYYEADLPAALLAFAGCFYFGE